MVSDPTDVFGWGPMAEQARALDWSRTALGPVERWPWLLRRVTRITFASSFPQVVLWGPELIQIYNDAYKPLIGAKHPRALGQRAAECWAEIWSTLGPMFERVLRQGEPVWAQDQRFLLHRNEYLEETYFTFSYSAIIDEGGDVCGVLVTCFETTATVLQEQRLLALSELATAAARVESVAHAGETVSQVFSRHPHLFAFVLVYLIESDGRARLLFASGLAGRPDIGPSEIPLDLEPRGGAAWPVAEATRSRKAVRVDDVAQRFGVVAGPNPDEPVRSAVIVPLAVGGGTAGVAIFGANPRRVLDDAYAGFFEYAGVKVSIALSHAQAEEIERGHREELEARVVARTAQLENANRELLAEVRERRRVEADLQLYSQRLAEVSRDLINAHERERRSVARELHDEIGQSLTLLKLGLQTSRDLPANLKVAALNHAETDITRLLDFVRNLSLDLRPALLDDLGLLPALFGLLERFQTRNKLTCHFQHDGICGRRFPTTVETTAYRVVQEALTNAMRYAGVTTVQLKVWADDDQMQVRVEDEGCGFELAGALASQTSSGLSGMRERVHLAGGELTIVTATDSGTQIIAELPLRTPPAFPAGDDAGTGEATQTGPGA